MAKREQFPSEAAGFQERDPCPPWPVGDDPPSQRRAGCLAAAEANVDCGPDLREPARVRPRGKDGPFQVAASRLPIGGDVLERSVFEGKRCLAVDGGAPG